MLQVLDQQWKDHLASMDYLRQGIHLRGYAQKNPKQEYKRESYDLFVDLLARVNYQVISTLLRLELRVAETEERPLPPPAPLPYKMTFQHDEVDALNNPVVNDAPPEENTLLPFLRAERKIGRNEVCPCGSGRKHKHCHGALSG